MIPILLAAVAIITPDDYFMIQAQENWVLDQLKKPVGYHQYLPPEIAEQIDVFDDDCWRCRRNANKAIVAMGEPALRWLFWTLRSTNVSIQLHSEACIRGLISCSKCGGSGTCTKYVSQKYKHEEWEWEYCGVCGRSKTHHDDPSYPRECRHCGGSGIFGRTDD